MKVAVIGGGSSYTPELVNGFLERIDTFPADRTVADGRLPERLEVVGGFAQRMVAAKGAPFQVVLTTDRRAAIARRRLCHHPTAGGRDGGAAPGRVPGPAPRADRPGDDRRRRHGQGAAHDPGHPGIAARHGRAGPRRAAGQLHQPGRPGHRGAGPLCARMCPRSASAMWRSPPRCTCSSAGRT